MRGVIGLREGYRAMSVKVKQSKTFEKRKMSTSSEGSCPYMASHCAGAVDTAKHTRSLLNGGLGRGSSEPLALHHLLPPLTPNANRLVGSEGWQSGRQTAIGHRRERCVQDPWGTPTKNHTSALRALVPWQGQSSTW